MIDKLLLYITRKLVMRIYKKYDINCYDDQQFIYIIDELLGYDYLYFNGDGKYTGQRTFIPAKRFIDYVEIQKDGTRVNRKLPI